VWVAAWRSSGISDCGLQRQLLTGLKGFQVIKKALVGTLSLNPFNSGPGSLSDSPADGNIHPSQKQSVNIRSLTLGGVD